MKVKINRRSAMQLWRSLPEPKDGICMPYPRGNPKSKILLLTGTPDEDEYDAQVPFSNNKARFFHAVLEECGVDTESFFVIACCREGAKALTKNTEVVMSFVQEALKQGVFDFVISVGDDATRWIVNGGKKVNMSHFCGKLVYPPNLHYKPLFVYPDLSGLYPKKVENERQNYLNNRAAYYLADRIRKYTMELMKYLKHRKKEYGPTK